MPLRSHQPPYIGRFAPSPTGALHAGSLVAALASWLDARVHGGLWLVRIEDVDTPRCVPGAAEEIMRQLAACGLVPDEPPVYQSERSQLYQTALDLLIAQQAAYPCACSRKDIEAAWVALGLAKSRHGELIYPGICRSGLQGRHARAWRMDTLFFTQNKPLALTKYAPSAHDLIANSGSIVHWHDRRLGSQQQQVAQEVGDFVLRRADGLWAYQLAVVVDDAAQGITHIVRGEDLADNTARQILLQQALKLPTPHYLHTPLVMATDGQKLSKQNGAQALNLRDESEVLTALLQAAHGLSLLPESAQPTNREDLLQQCLAAWRERWQISSTVLKQ
jgi:glutamyl-Q tRNA(Asp) synthetase